MKKLERQEMKNLKGGMNAPPEGFYMAQSGWELYGSNCLCDYTYMYPNGSTYSVCGQPCPTLCCTQGSTCGIWVN